MDEHLWHIWLCSAEWHLGTNQKQLEGTSFVSFVQFVFNKMFASVKSFFSHIFA